MSRFTRVTTALLLLVVIAFAPALHAAGFLSNPGSQVQPSKRTSTGPAQVESAGPSAVEPPVLVAPIPPNANPYGASLGTWGARWWQWAVSAPLFSDPITDPDGSFCDYGQSGPVWFLAGNFGGETVRTCSVPSGKALLVPVLNFFAEYPCPPEFGFEPAPGQSLEDFLREFVMAAIDGATNLSVVVDGVSLGDLSAYRSTSDLFEITLHPSWVDVDPCVTGTPQPAVSDGYYVMLSPLPPGQHTVQIHSELPDFAFVLDVTYYLTVLPGQSGRGSIAGSGEPSTWSLVKTLYK